MGPLKMSKFSFKDLFPKSLFKRAFLIIVLPLILVQIVFTVVFLDRFLDSVTKNLASNIARTTKVVVDLYSQNPNLASDIAFELGVLTQYAPEADLKSINGTHLDAWEDQFLQNALQNTLEQPFLLTTTPHILTVHVQTETGIMSISVLRKKLMSRTTILVFLWVFGATALFLIIASIFMRNQVRPIQRLALAAENFGKGLSMDDFKPAGASEVRQAAKAFNLMRERIVRQITQRTDMLAGISHDLRTPLTRMKLELALLPENPKLDAIKNDIQEMEILIQEYLDFVKGHAQEKKQQQDLGQLIEECVSESRSNQDIHIKKTGRLLVTVRPKSLKRALKNLLENAQRYSERAEVKIYKRDQSVHIVIDDNGKGIPPAKREEVFKPFVRLETSRNQKTGGTGLGLSIAQDIIHQHGGRIILGKSLLGGLRVHVKIPL